MQILGNEENLKHLKDSADKGRLSHAYIISGPEGSGKKTFAGFAAATLLCERREPSLFSACGACPSCKRALSGNHPDIIRVTHEKKNVLSIDEIRAKVVSDVDIKPYYGPHKIYIIEDAQLMQPQAQNALLKTIEEPPSYAIFFLLADNADILLDTVKSRAITLRISPLDDSLICRELQKEGLSSKKASELAAFCAGNLGMAKKLAAQDPQEEVFSSRIANLVSDINKTDARRIFEISEELSVYPLSDITNTLRKWYRDVLVCKSRACEKLYFPGKRSELLALSQSLSYEAICRIFSDIDEADDRAYFNVASKTVCEALLLRIRQNG